LACGKLDGFPAREKYGVGLVIEPFIRVSRPSGRRMDEQSGFKDATIVGEVLDKRGAHGEVKVTVGRYINLAIVG
jgi:hypothetical protein